MLTSSQSSSASPPPLIEGRRTGVGRFTAPSLSTSARAPVADRAMAIASNAIACVRRVASTSACSANSPIVRSSATAASAAARTCLTVDSTAAAADASSHAQDDASRRKEGLASSWARASRSSGAAELGTSARSTVRGRNSRRASSMSSGTPSRTHTPASSCRCFSRSSTIIIERR